MRIVHRTEFKGVNKSNISVQKLLIDLAPDAESARGEADLSFEHIAELGIVHEPGSRRYPGDVHLGVQQQGLGIIQTLQ
ncbi:hypothetical protein D3C74_303360 [compost metagenome]